MSIHKLAKKFEKKLRSLHEAHLAAIIIVVAVIVSAGIVLVTDHVINKDTNNIASGTNYKNFYPKGVKSVNPKASSSQTPTPGSSSIQAPSSTVPTSTPNRSVTSPSSKSNSSPTSTPTQSGSSQALTSAVAYAPVFTDGGSYAATSGTNLGQCAYNESVTYSVNGSGATYANEYMTTNDPDDGPNSSNNIYQTTWSQAGQQTFSDGTSSFSTNYGSHVLISDYYKVYNTANNQLLATSPVSQFQCP